MSKYMCCYTCLKYQYSENHKQLCSIPAENEALRRAENFYTPKRRMRSYVAGALPDIYIKCFSETKFTQENVHTMQKTDCNTGRSARSQLM